MWLNGSVVVLRKWWVDRCGSSACEGRQHVGSTAEYGRGNVAATMRVRVFGGDSVALSVALLVGVLAVVALWVSVVF